MIPKIIHQIWIGPVPPPQKLLDTWRDMNPGWEYRLWTNHKGWKNQAQIDAMREWNGKADLMRYEILLEHGGVHIDADTECVKPLDDHFLDHEVWASYENEIVRPWIIASGFMGAVPGHPLFQELVERVAKQDMNVVAWKSVGPVFFTEVVKTHPELYIYPARTFIPKHYTREEPAPSDIPTYGNHVWGNTIGYGRFVAEVAIVIPCKGQAKFLPDAMKSVKWQTKKAAEIIIACGDDESVDAALKFEDVPGVKIHSGCNKGVGHARNTAIRAAKSPYILPLDADDMLVPKFLEATTAQLKMDGRHEIVSTWVEDFGDKEGVWRLPNPATFRQQNPFSTSSLFAKSLWEAAGGYDETLGSAFEDWEFWIRCMKLTPRVAVIGEPMLRHRSHPESAMARTERENLYAEYRGELRKRHPDLFPEGPGELGVGWKIGT